MKEIDEQKRKALLIKELLDTDGWDVLKAELLADGDRLNEKLVKSNDAAEDIVTKAQIRAIGILINKIVAYSQIKT